MAARKKTARSRSRGSVVDSVERELKDLSREVERRLRPLQREIAKAERQAGSEAVM